MKLMNLGNDHVRNQLWFAKPLSELNSADLTKRKRENETVSQETLQF